jgi:site-specific DNA-methyltransferase (adenine-specific)
MSDKVIIGDCTLYLADCMDILPTLGKVDAVVTDPPYGLGRDGGNFSTSSHGGRKPYEFLGWDSSTPDASLFDSIFSLSNDQIIWGANYFAKHLPPKMGWLVWDKGQSICSSDCELAFTSRDSALRRIVMNRVELQKDGTAHPTQKPVALMEWCLSFLPKAQTILDPFMGSGTTGVACVRTGRKFIGIEKEPKYFEIACKRIKAEYERTALFEPVPTVEQAELFSETS